MPSPEDITLKLGAARLRLRPLEPLLWQPLAQLHPGPADLCLKLLPLGLRGWQGVRDRAGRRPPARAGHPAALPAWCLPLLLETLCAPWLSQAERAELEQLERFAGALADFPGLDCASCREQRDRGEPALDCATCPRGHPPPSAVGALLLLPWLEPGPAWSLLGQGLAGCLGPRQARLLAMRLALLQRRLARTRPPGRDLAPPGDSW